jgi:hypothetical protein
VFARVRSAVLLWPVIGVLAALAAGWPASACAAVAATGEAGPVLLAQAPAADGPHENTPNTDADKQPWEERLDRKERNQLITVGIFLGVVLLGLLLWWGWGKVYHRPRKL